MALLKLVAAATLLMVSYWVGWCVYCLWFHPLAKYPGPRLAAISEIWYVQAYTSGQYQNIIYKAHLDYGDVVRIAPNELSFGTAEAMRDILGPPTKSRKLFTKSVLFYDIEGIAPLAYETDPQKHAQRFKLLSPGFRTQALRDQEHVIHEHVDLLLDYFGRVSEASENGVDTTKAFQWLTFDITGALCFGESFGAVKNGKPHFWVETLLGWVFGASVYVLRKRLPIIGLLFPIMPLVSSSAHKMADNMTQHAALTTEKVRKRLQMRDDDAKTKEDIFAHAIQTGALSEDELTAEARSIIVAGSETTANALNAAVWFLLTSQQPTAGASALTKLQREVRGRFARYDDITGDAAAKLPYLGAVVEEILRLFTPVAMGAPRTSPGETVDGHYVPAGTCVSANPWFIHHDGRKMASPFAFEPERWLDERGKGLRALCAPFSLGPRACIGVNLAYLEMRVTLAKLVFRYDWGLLCDAGYDWVSECKYYMMWQEAELRVSFHPRAGC